MRTTSFSFEVIETIIKSSYGMQLVKHSIIQFQANIRSEVNQLI